MADEPVKDYLTAATYVRYDEAGNIEQMGSQGVAFTTDDMAKGERILLTNLTWNPHNTDFKQYVDVAKRKVLDKTNGTSTLDGNTLRGLPVPCTITIRDALSPEVPGTKYAWTDPTCALTFDHVGIYMVRVTSAPYLPQDFMVHYDG